MTEPILRDIADLREWLVRKMDVINEIKLKADEAKQISLGNREDIRDMKANTKWVWGVMLTVVGLIVTIAIAVFK